MKGPYEKAAIAMKYSMLVFAAALVIVGILHFVAFDVWATYNHFIFTVYLFLFAAIICLVEFSVWETRTWFYFMNFGFGKGIFLFFVGLILLGAGNSVTWVDILVGIIFILSAIAFAVLSKVYRLQEVDFVNDLLENVEKNRQEKEKAAANRT